ncbi:MAG: hypothetical protein HOO06_08665 [Bdellovibrionaceae bacterium]|nr:hypothetical protein [Pseudobdellovibrionaceae bacterium]
MKGVKILWDAHICMPLKRDGDLSSLELFKKVGFKFLSVNADMDYTPIEDVVSTPEDLEQIEGGNFFRVDEAN